MAGIEARVGEEESVLSGEGEGRRERNVHGKHRIRVACAHTGGSATDLAEKKMDTAQAAGDLLFVMGMLSAK